MPVMQSIDAVGAVSALRLSDPCFGLPFLLSRCWKRPLMRRVISFAGKKSMLQGTENFKSQDLLDPR